jgi:DNA-binding Xre family transcriptional regulator
MAMGHIMDALRDALNAKTTPLREIERETGVNVALLSHISRGTRPAVSMDTLETLCEYLGLELRQVRKRKKG